MRRALVGGGREEGGIPPAEVRAEGGSPLGGPAPDFWSALRRAAPVAAWMEGSVDPPTSRPGLGLRVPARLVRTNSASRAPTYPQVRSHVWHVEGRVPRRERASGRCRRWGLGAGDPRGESRGGWARGGSGAESGTEAGAGLGAGVACDAVGLNETSTQETSGGEAPMTSPTHTPTDPRTPTPWPLVVLVPTQPFERKSRLSLPRKGGPTRGGKSERAHPGVGSVSPMPPVQTRRRGLESSRLQRLEPRSRPSLSVHAQGCLRRAPSGSSGGRPALRERGSAGVGASPSRRRGVDIVVAHAPPRSRPLSDPSKRLSQFS